MRPALPPDCPELRDALSRWSNCAVWGGALPPRARVPGRRLALRPAFLEYLLSDDTRLPRGVLAAAPDDPAHYDGELRRRGSQGPAATAAAAAAAGPSFDAEVAEVRVAFGAVCDGRPRDAGYGLEVEGSFGALRDAPWATLNGGARCIDPRDVFTVLRASCRLHRDLEWQLRHPGVQGPAVWLRRHCEWHNSSLYRVLVDRGVVAAVSQFSVDQVHGELADLDAAALEELRRKIAAVAARLVAAVRAAEAGAPSPAVAEWGAAPSLLVDVAHEGGTLPVIVTAVTAVRSLEDCCDAPAHKAAAEARAVGPGDEPFALGDTHPLAFRILRSLEAVRAFAAGDGGRQVAVAREAEDLCGDGQLMGGGAAATVPVELRHPELFDVDDETRALLLSVASRVS